MSKSPPNASLAQQMLSVAKTRIAELCSQAAPINDQIFSLRVAMEQMGHLQPKTLDLILELADEARAGAPAAVALPVVIEDAPPPAPAPETEPSDPVPDPEPVVVDEAPQVEAAHVFDEPSPQTSIADETRSLIREAIRKRDQKKPEPALTPAPEPEHAAPPIDEAPMPARATQAAVVAKITQLLRTAYAKGEKHVLYEVATLTKLCGDAPGFWLSKAMQTLEADGLIALVTSGDVPRGHYSIQIKHKIQAS